MEQINEIFKAIIGYEGLYEISNLGRVKSLEKFGIRICHEKIMSLTKNKHGYYHVALCKNGKKQTFLVSRLVAIHFIPNKKKLPCVNHIDNNRINNIFTNLEWVTHKGNSEHAVKQGRHYHGERVNTNKLKKEDVLKIIEISNDFSQGQLAKKYGVTQNLISKILLGQTWKSIERDIKIKNKPYNYGK